MDQLVRRGPPTRGLRRTFILCTPGAPFCEENDDRPRLGLLPSPSLDAEPRSASRLPLAAPSRCLEFASTTDVSRHEHPLDNTLLGDCPPAAVGKPAGFRLRDLSLGRRFRRTFEKDAGPPRGHPASNNRVLDGALAGFRSTGIRPCARALDDRAAAALSAVGRLRQ